jgi:hypothetical protein
MQKILVDLLKRSLALAFTISVVAVALAWLLSRLN